DGDGVVAGVAAVGGDADAEGDAAHGDGVGAPEGVDADGTDLARVEGGRLAVQGDLHAAGGGRIDHDVVVLVGQLVAVDEEVIGVGEVAHAGGIDGPDGVEAERLGGAVGDDEGAELEGPVRLRD